MTLTTTLFISTMLLAAEPSGVGVLAASLALAAIGAAAIAARSADVSPRDQNPIAVGLADLDQRFDHEIRQLTRERDHLVTDIADAERDEFKRFGNGHDYQHTQRLQNHEYAKDWESFCATMRAKRERINALETELDVATRRRRVETDAFMTTCVVGGEIPVPAVTLRHPADDDRDLAKWQAEIEAIEAELPQLREDRDAVARHLAVVVADVHATTALRRLDLKSDRDVVESGAIAQKAERALAQIDARIPDREARGVALRSQQDTRRAELDEQWASRLSAERRRAESALADALIPLMAAVTYRLRLGRAPLGWQFFDLLNADEPRSEGRDWLQSARDAGWTPSTKSTTTGRG